MDISLDQFRKINDLISKANAGTNAFMEGIERIQDRITKLHSQEFHVEAMILNGQAIEHALKEILKAFQDRRGIYEILGITNPHANIALSEKLFRQPLKTLIDTLRRFIGATDLVKELDYFNEHFRRQLVHYAYFTNEENYKKIEEEAIEYMRREDKLGNLVKMLSDKRRCVVNETEELYPHI